MHDRKVRLSKKPGPRVPVSPLPNVAPDSFIGPADRSAPQRATWAVVFAATDGGGGRIGLSVFLQGVSLGVFRRIAEFVAASHLISPDVPDW